MIVRRLVPSEGGWLSNYGELNELRRQMQSLVGEMEAFSGRRYFSCSERYPG